MAQTVLRTNFRCPPPFPHHHRHQNHRHQHYHHRHQQHQNHRHHSDNHRIWSEQLIFCMVQLAVLQQKSKWNKKGN